MPPAVVPPSAPLPPVAPAVGLTASPWDQSDDDDETPASAWQPDAPEPAWQDGPDEGPHGAADPDAQESVSPDDPAWAVAPVDIDDAVTEPTSASDWLDRICPYLASEDGTSRSTHPDERHRCTAQDPPATLPLAFQERFCLTDRHVRCEMYKVAEDARAAAFAQDSIAAEQVKSARFRPTVRSRPVALEPSSSAPVVAPASSGPDRQILIALGGAGAFALVLLVIAVLLGGGGGGTPGGLTTTPTDGGPVATPAPVRTAAPQASFDGVVVTEPPASAGQPIMIRYEVQPEERLQKISDTFGTTIRAIVRANPDFGDEGNPRDARPGDEIFVPVSPQMTEDEIMAVPGFIEFVQPEA
jgi:hypothetical protein